MTAKKGYSRANTTQPIKNEELTRLTRASNEDARPTSQIDPTELRKLLEAAPGAAPAATPPPPNKWSEATSKSVPRPDLRIATPAAPPAPQPSRRAARALGSPGGITPISLDQVAAAVNAPAPSPAAPTPEPTAVVPSAPAPIVASDAVVPVPVVASDTVASAPAAAEAVAAAVVPEPAAAPGLAASATASVSVPPAVELAPPVAASPVVEAPMLITNTDAVPSLKGATTMTWVIAAMIVVAMIALAAALL